MLCRPHRERSLLISNELVANELPQGGEMVHPQQLNTQEGLQESMAEILALNKKKCFPGLCNKVIHLAFEFSALGSIKVGPKFLG